jgi:nitronate monooxygenase
LPLPIVQAPLSGGASTPELTIAASRAGAFGILAGGYLTTERLREDIHRVRSSTAAAFGVNLFVPGEDSANPAALRSYAERVRADASRVGAEPGDPKWSDDEWQSKLELVLRERPAVVSFTFGCPERGVFDNLRRAGIEAWVTVTEPDEAELAAEAGADALVVQGFEAGGHRASFVDQDGVGEVGLLTLIRLVWRRVQLPLVAAGVAFVGDLNRVFRAVDVNTGKELWRTTLPTSVQGFPVSFAVAGKQYIAVSTGAGGGSPRLVPSQIIKDIAYPDHGNAMYVFALDDQ